MFPTQHRRNLAIAAIAGSLDDETPVIGLMDLDLLDEQFAQLVEAFESEKDVLHSVACKAVPLRSLLNHYASVGAGCEVASPGELELAVAAGFPAERIVFDSPAKTSAELSRALELGVAMNIDNFQELERVDALLRSRPATATASASATTSASIGIRINPQTGSGTIGAMSTATSTSKFGIGLRDEGARDAVIAAYASRPWLNLIHIHSGSQGVSLDHAATGLAEVVALAHEINNLVGHRQITRIDIGGGLPVNFAGEEITPTFAEYRKVLDERVPGLFEFDLITEFGRSLLAKAGTIAARIEYVKTTGGRRIAMSHAGVQVATRTVYAPQDWPLRILPFDGQGQPKAVEESVESQSGPELIAHDVAGPACFAGDLLARDRMLPRLDAGDIIAVPETGAYYFSNPFSYNLLPRTPIIGYRAADEDGALEFSSIRRGQTVEEILAEAGPAGIEPLSTMLVN